MLFHNTEDTSPSSEPMFAQDLTWITFDFTAPQSWGMTELRT